MQAATKIVPTAEYNPYDCIKTNIHGAMNLIDVCKFKKNRKVLRYIALTTDTSVLTCIANDCSDKGLYSRQIEALGRAGDVLVAVSTFGNSEKVMDKLKMAKTLGVNTITLFGKDGGLAKSLSYLSMIIRSNSAMRIQEVHVLISHILCDLIERELGCA